MNKYIIKSGTEKKEFFNRLYKEAEYIILPNEKPLTIESRAFENCINLKEITLSENINFIGNKVFFNCISLEKVDFKANVKEISEGMFYNCDLLESLDLSNFDTSNVNNMNIMFLYCSSLKLESFLNLFLKFLIYYHQFLYFDYCYFFQSYFFLVYVFLFLSLICQTVLPQPVLEN